MTNFIIDSWAWVEYLSGTERGLKLKDIMTKDNNLFTSIVSFAEIVSAARRKNMSIDTIEDAILSSSEIVNIDIEISKKSGIFHSEIRKTINDFGLGDAFVVITARYLNAKIVTGDQHFKGMKEAVLI